MCIEAAFQTSQNQLDSYASFRNHYFDENSNNCNVMVMVASLIDLEY